MLHLKTEAEIERDFYTFLTEGPVGGELRGQVYRKGMRPANATTEDAVVMFLSGLDTLLQTGVVVCDIYVPDIEGDGGRLVPDLARIAELQSAVHRFLDDFPCTDDYQIGTDETMATQYDEAAGQHYIYVRFRFARRAS